MALRFDDADELSLSACTFYHVMDLPVIGVVGNPNNGWDLRGRFDEYTGRVPMAGKTLIDVGTASGFLTFEAERRGATVTSFDAERPDQWQFLPYKTDCDFAENFYPLRRSYELAHRALKSSAKLLTGDIYHLSEFAPRVDIGLVAQILVHLRDPLEALRQVSLIVDERLIIVEGSYEADAPTMVLLGGKGNYYSWFHLSERLYREYLPILGFEIESISRGYYRCNNPHVPADVELWTFVAKRSEAIIAHIAPP